MNGKIHLLSKLILVLCIFSIPAMACIPPTAQPDPGLGGMLVSEIPVGDLLYLLERMANGQIASVIMQNGNTFAFIYAIDKSQTGFIFLEMSNSAFSLPRIWLDVQDKYVVHTVDDLEQLLVFMERSEADGGGGYQFIRWQDLPVGFIRVLRSYTEQCVRQGSTYVTELRANWNTVLVVPVYPFYNPILEQHMTGEDV